MLSVLNTGKRNVEMPMIVVPIPPGFRVIRSKRHHSAHYKFEDVGGERRIYLPNLAPGQPRSVAYALEAENVVDVLARPVLAYGYYRPGIRGSSAPESLRAYP